MRLLFCNQDKFNDNINSWDVSNVTDMTCMFWGSYNFDQPLDKWDVGNVVTHMSF
jgi:surface protein